MNLPLSLQNSILLEGFPDQLSLYWSVSTCLQGTIHAVSLTEHNRACLMQGDEELLFDLLPQLCWRKDHSPLHNHA